MNIFEHSISECSPLYTANSFFATLISLFLLQGFKPLCEVIKVDVIIIPWPALGSVPTQRSVTWHSGEVRQVEDIASCGGRGWGRGATGHRRLVRGVIGGRPIGIIQVIDVRGMVLGPGPRGLRRNVVLEGGRG